MSETVKETYRITKTASSWPWGHRASHREVPTANRQTGDAIPVTAADRSVVHGKCLDTARKHGAYPIPPVKLYLQPILAVPEPPARL